jgi:hypothetical protein
LPKPVEIVAVRGNRSAEKLPEPAGHAREVAFGRSGGPEGTINVHACSQTVRAVPRTLKLYLVKQLFYNTNYFNRQ